MSLEEDVFSKGHRLLQEYLGLNYQKYASNTLWLVSERVLRLGINLFVSVWIARCLGRNTSVACISPSVMWICSGQSR